jgi:hypothetical protein
MTVKGLFPVNEYHMLLCTTAAKNLRPFLSEAGKAKNPSAGLN